MSVSIRRTDILALSHLREDGRKPNETRRVRIQLGPLMTSMNCTGSALIEMGLTVALATVRGPMDCVRRSDELPDRAIVEASVQVAPFGHLDRRTTPLSDRRLIEASTWLRTVLEATILVHLYPKSRVEVIVTILADDGGRICAAINAASLAAVDAGISMKDVVVACAAGYAGGINMDMTIVDLNRKEEGLFAGQAAVNLPVAMMPQRGTIVLTQSEARLPNFATMERVMQAAQNGCLSIFEVMQAAIRERSMALLTARSGKHSHIGTNFAMT